MEIGALISLLTVVSIAIISVAIVIKGPTK